MTKGSKPEEQARATIDRQLELSGWVIQDRHDMQRNAGVGVAVREFTLPGGACDYLLFVDGRAAGVIEAKPAGFTLSGASGQSRKYRHAMPKYLAAWSDPLPIEYVSSGAETYFLDSRDPMPRSRAVYGFHRPETLRGWLGEPRSLRRRLTSMPVLDESGLRQCQVRAVRALEESLAVAEPRALIQMATGAGKTFAACTFCYRLIKYAGAKRILFLVDRKNLGEQALREFAQFELPGDGRRFGDVYATQNLRGSTVAPEANIVVTTIHRLYAMLCGAATTESDDAPGIVDAGLPDAPVYNPDLPIETFDFIVTDECHRSIYGQWRQVLEYFDAFIIGMTATPSQQTLGYFGHNLVSEYPFERSVADGVNVGFEVYRIRTRVGDTGGIIKAGYTVPARERKTRRLRYREIDRDIEYGPEDLDRSVVVPNQIRTIMQAFKDQLSKDLFPERRWVPKTLIFAKNDSHAEDIVHIVREVFQQGDRFCKKITYRTWGENSDDLIKAFRSDLYPRVAVTVDMIATGTDIRPIEVVLFMRDVRSEIYFEQMIGRGARTTRPGELRAVTPDGHDKTRFIVVDAIGVTEGKKSVSQPLERSRGVSFGALLQRVAGGACDDDTLSSLAGRLAALRARNPIDKKLLVDMELSDNWRIDITNALLDAVDPDKIECEAVRCHGLPVTAETRRWIKGELRKIACAPFDEPGFRAYLTSQYGQPETIVDEITVDEVVSLDIDDRWAHETIVRFRAFIAGSEESSLALRVLLAPESTDTRLTYASISDLVKRLARSLSPLRIGDIWSAYARLNPDRVGRPSIGENVTDIIPLVLFSLGRVEKLEPFSAHVERNFDHWLEDQTRTGRHFTKEQGMWLQLFKEHIAVNAVAEPGDLSTLPPFSDRGGLVRAQAVFGPSLVAILSEMSASLGLPGAA